MAINQWLGSYHLLELHRKIKNIKMLFRINSITLKCYINNPKKLGKPQFQEKRIKYSHNKTQNIKTFWTGPQKLDRKNLTFGVQFISTLDTMRFLNLKTFWPVLSKNLFKAYQYNRIIVICYRRQSQNKSLRFCVYLPSCSLISIEY